ncbi:MAG: ABC transporter substrate-binding protein [Chloroflexi bacterium]|nr:ABC transporter substrate-binding protein [Chloroflexota bacterium]
MRICVALLALACVVAGACTPAAAPSATTSPSVHIKVGIQGVGGPLEIAYRRGYFAEQGLDLEEVPFNSGAEASQALATNQVQVGSGSPNAATFNALGRNIDLRIVGDWSHVGSPTDTTLALLVGKNAQDNIKSVADLKGRKLAILGAPGNVGDFFMARALQGSGVSLSDIQVSYLGASDILAALANGAVDAITINEPLGTQAQQQFGAKLLVPAGAVMNGSELSVLEYSPDLANNTDAATGFMIGYLRGVRDWNAAFHDKQGTADVVNLLVQYTPIKDANIWTTAPAWYVEPNGKINVSDLQDQLDFQIQAGQVKSPPDLSKYVDSRFAEQAVQKLGAQ